MFICLSSYSTKTIMMLVEILESEANLTFEGKLPSSYLDILDKYTDKLILQTLPFPRDSANN